MNIVTINDNECADLWVIPEQVERQQVKNGALMGQFKTTSSVLEQIPLTKQQVDSSRFQQMSLYFNCVYFLVEV